MRGRFLALREEDFDASQELARVLVGQMIRTWRIGITAITALVFLAVGGWAFWKLLGPTMEIISTNLRLPRRTRGSRPIPP